MAWKFDWHVLTRQTLNTNWCHEQLVHRIILTTCDASAFPLTGIHAVPCLCTTKHDPNIGSSSVSYDFPTSAITFLIGIATFQFVRKRRTAAKWLLGSSRSRTRHWKVEIRRSSLSWHAINSTATGKMCNRQRFSCVLSTDTHVARAGIRSVAFFFSSSYVLLRANAVWSCAAHKQRNTK